jgi:hypothetical protein
MSVPKLNNLFLVETQKDGQKPSFWVFVLKEFSMLMEQVLPYQAMIRARLVVGMEGRR